MSAITPQTELRLLKCPIESDNLNQLRFNTIQEQYRFFNSLPKLEVDNFTYQRKDNIIRYPAHIDSILEYNYVMYQNENYTDKWFYAFITNMEYVNDNLTLITIKTDVYQTWLFQMVWKRSFVEREHVNDDTIGLHTIPEKLETGEYVCNEVNRIFNGMNTYICISVSDCPGDMGKRATLYYNGVFSGTENLLFRDYQAAANFIKAMDRDAKGDGVVSVFLVPQSLFSDLTLNWQVITVTNDSGISTTFEVSRIPVNSNSVYLQTSNNITIPATLDGYSPKNNKLKVYPYTYFYTTNNVGTDISWKFEDFANNTAVFKTVGSLTPGCSVKCIPINYKKVADTSSTLKSFNSGFPISKYPICSWTNDTYVNWLTSNSLNIGMKAVGAAAGIVGGAALIVSGAGATVGVGMIAGGIGMIADSVKETYQHSLTPDQASGNSNSGDVTYSSNKLEAVAYSMSVRSEMAKVIDDYFTMYGYKVNSLKIPNITGRQNWNYVKTLQANIEGDIPENDINELKTIFNNGITIWHHANTYLDYSQNNNII